MRFTCFSAAMLTFLLEQEAAAVKVEDLLNDFDGELELAQSSTDDWNDYFHAQLNALRPGGEMNQAQTWTGNDQMS